jgi:hypothetical protein
MVSIIILYYNIIILWYKPCVCCPSLTETSLCGAYLYICVSLLCGPDNSGRLLRFSEKEGNFSPLQICYIDCSCPNLYRMGTGGVLLRRWNGRNVKLYRIIPKLMKGALPPLPPYEFSSYRGKLCLFLLFLFNYWLPFCHCSCPHSSFEKLTGFYKILCKYYANRDCPKGALYWLSEISSNNLTVIPICRVEVTMASLNIALLSRFREGRYSLKCKITTWLSCQIFLCHSLWQLYLTTNNWW